MKNKFVIFLMCSSCLFISCVTRAPSNYELDRRAGRLPKKADKTSQSIAKEIHAIKGQDKVPIDPIHINPHIEKIWIYNQEINDGTYLQGTYVFFQIDNGYWFNPSEQKL